MKNLIAHLEKATGPDRDLDAKIWRAVDPEAVMEKCGFRGLKYAGHIYAPNEKTEYIMTMAAMRAPVFTASIDAALTLVPVGKDWHIEMCDGCALAAIGERIDIAFEPHKVPAVALCIAALKSRSVALVSA
jgi:hypothetical protein